MAADNNELIFKSTRLPNRSFMHFEFMRRKGQFCDINFTIGDQTLSAHRVVLAAGIPYFYEMLSTKRENLSENELDMPDIDYKTWKSLIDYAYNGEVKINVNNVKQLLSAACLLSVEEVKTACCNFWAERMCLENSVSIQDFASGHDCTELAEKAGHFIRKNFDKISETEDFLELSFSYLSDLICADDLKVDSEEKVFEAVIRWIKRDQENRKQYLHKILRNIRLPLLKPHYLGRIVLDEELIHESMICRDIITEARNYNTLTEEEKMLCRFSSVPRNSNKNERQEKENEDVISIISTELSLTVNHFNPLTEEWCITKRQLCPLDGSVLISMDRELYFFYGTNVFECTSPEYNWKSCSRRYLRHFAASAALGNQIYICGGINGDSACNTVECFDPKSREWISVASMKISRIFPTAVSLQERLYIMGGMNGCSVLNSVERYSPLTKTWTDVSPMLTKRWGLGCTAVNDKIYVSGGMVPGTVEKCVSTTEVYNPATNQWAFVSSMNIPRWFLPILPYGEKLCALGGKDDSGKYINVIEIYDPETNEWKFGKPSCLQSPISGAVVISSSDS